MLMLTSLVIRLSGKCSVKKCRCNRTQDITAAVVFVTAAVVLLVSSVSV